MILEVSLNRSYILEYIAIFGLHLNLGNKLQNNNFQHLKLTSQARQSVVQ